MGLRAGRNIEMAQMLLDGIEKGKKSVFVSKDINVACLPLEDYEKLQAENKELKEELNNPDIKWVSIEELKRLQQYDIDALTKVQVPKILSDEDFKKYVQYKSWPKIIEHFTPKPTTDEEG